MITHDDVVVGAKRIAGHIRNTPIVSLESQVLSVPVLAKLDLLQHTGAFKVRGALNAVLAAVENDAINETGVIAASGGNHGLAVAYAARKAGVPAEIFVPETTPQIKLQRLASYGADVRLAGQQISEAFDACRQRQDQTGAFFVHAFDNPDVVAGQGSVALEVLAAASVDTIVVATGGGGLAAGVHLAAGSQRRVIAVEPEGIPTLHDAVAAGRPVPISVRSIASDALGAWQLGEIPWQVLKPAVAAGSVVSVVVPDQAIIATQQVLWDQLRLIAEPGGATAAAALLAGVYVPEPGERVAVVLCGSNTDPATVTSRSISDTV